MPALREHRLLERLDHDHGVHLTACQRGGLLGNGSATNSTFDGSPPAVRTEARTLVSTMLDSVFAATVLPSRSFAALMGLSPFTISPAKSSPSTPVKLLPLLTTLTGSPSDCATSNETTLLNPNWYCRRGSP